MKVIDLFCGAGGLGEGYHRAGFMVTGIDCAPQPSYPHTFVQTDAMVWLRYNYANLDADLIHASPPCQHYSRATGIRPGARDKHPDLIGELRQLLELSGKPYVIENVPGAPLRADIKLWGYMFGLPIIRERWFELGGWWTLQPQITKPRGSAHAGDFVTVAGQGHRYNTRKGHNGPEAIARTVKCWKGSIVETWRHAMNCPWMQTRRELANACPPDYSKWIGERFKEWKEKQQPKIQAWIQKNPEPFGRYYRLQIGKHSLVWANDGHSRSRRPSGSVLRSDGHSMDWEPADPSELLTGLREWLPQEVAQQIWELPAPSPSPSPPVVEPYAECPQCGKGFKPTTRKQRYCGGACRTAACRGRKHHDGDPPAAQPEVAAPPPWTFALSWDWLVVKHRDVTHGEPKERDIEIVVVTIHGGVHYERARLTKAGWVAFVAARRAVEKVIADHYDPQHPGNPDGAGNHKFIERAQRLAEKDLREHFSQWLGDPPTTSGAVLEALETH